MVVNASNLPGGRVAVCGEISGVVSARHCPELDGVRGIAIALVLMVHLALVPDPGGYRGALPPGIAAVVGIGWIGVDLFFVLSGFLITGILVDSRESGVSLREYIRGFFVRRALRILPLYVVLLAAASLAFPQFGGYWMISSLFLSNYAHAFGVEVPDFAGVLWSLCVEEHFYLIFPWVVWLAPRSALTVLLVSVIVITPALRALGWHCGLSVPEVIYPQTQFRIDGLAFGGVIALFVRWTPWRSWSLGAVVGLMLAPVALGILAAPLGVMKSTTATSAACALRYSQLALAFAGVVLFAFAWSGRRATAPLRFPPPLASRTAVLWDLSDSRAGFHLGSRIA